MTINSRRISEGLYELDAEVASASSDQIINFLLSDPELEEIMFNGVGQPLMVCHRQIGMCRVNAQLDERYVMHFVQHIAQNQGQELSASHPIFDGALADGSRINVVLPPIAHHGVSFTIRKFLSNRLQLSDLVQSGTISSEAAAFLWCAFDGLGAAPANLLVVGGTGSGKTTTLGALLSLTPEKERIVLIEDTPEIQIDHPNVVRLVTQKEINMTDLMRSSLRMRPDRIIVGEVRGAEAVTLFESMNTGHSGCVGTLHANSARESINRISNPPMSVSLSQLTGLDLIIVQEKRANASPNRVVTEISEICGHGEGVLRMNQLFRFDEVLGRLVPTGIPSRFQAKLCAAADLSHSDFSAALWDRQSSLQKQN